MYKALICTHDKYNPQEIVACFCWEGEELYQRLVEDFATEDSVRSLIALGTIRTVTTKHGEEVFRRNETAQNHSLDDFRFQYFGNSVVIICSYDKPRGGTYKTIAQAVQDDDVEVIYFYQNGSYVRYTKQ